MKADIVTIFPDFFRGPLEYGITRRAQEMGLAEIKVHDLREFTHDRHRTVDDRPFGGGEGMVLKPEPLFECLESLGVAPREERLAGRVKQSVVLLSAQGQRFTQKVAAELALLDRIVLVCGRYEGVDERVADFLADRELSIGDYVLSGGEMAAAVIVEAVMRLLPGAVGNEASTQQESFTVDSKAKRLGRCRFDLRVERIAGLSALHAASGVSRDRGAGGIDVRQPRRDSAGGVASGRWKKLYATVLTCWKARR